MSPARARLATALAVALGAAGDVLLREEWYLGFVGFILLLLGAAWALTAGRTGLLQRSLLLAGSGLAAVGLILRDAQTLYLYDFLALLTGLALVAWLPLGRGLGRLRFRDPLRAWWASFRAVLGGALATLIVEPRWPRPLAKADRRLRSATIGVVLAVPPVFVVSALLAEADPAFKNFIVAWPDLGLENVAGHLLMAGAIAWPVAGWLRGTVHPTLPRPDRPTAGLSRLDFAGLMPVLYGLGSVITLYLTFQARGLFGGAAYVEATSGLTYAEYARRGFFELLTVTALVLGILLLSDHLLDRREAGADRRFRVTGWALILLLGVLMLSALQRMWVYVSYFGFSDTRLYATAGMAWVGMAVAWFGATILRGRRSRFGIGLLVASAGWVAALNVIDPEAVVVRVNLGRALVGAEFDVNYHAHLSADAVPALLTASRQLPAATCTNIIDKVYARWTARLEADDWRSWSLPRARVRRVVADRPVESLRQEYCGTSPTPYP